MTQDNLCPFKNASSFFLLFFSFSRCPSQKIFFSLLLCACGGLPRTHKLRFPLLRLQSRQRFHNYVKPEVTLKIDLALHASPAARNLTFQISSLPVHSAWFFSTTLFHLEMTCVEDNDSGICFNLMNRVSH